MAKVRTVYSTQDDGAGTLRDALRVTASYTSEWIDAGALENGDIIDFSDELEEDGVITILLSSQIDLPAKILTIDGGGHAGNGETLQTRVVLDAQQVGRHLRLTASSPNGVSVKDLTLCNGLVSGDGGVLTAVSSNINAFEFCVFKDNNANSAGAAFLSGTSQTIFSNCLFDNCQSTSSGGGIYTYSSTNNTFSFCSFRDCTATNSGGAFCTTQTSETLIENCLFNHCSANSGGALYATNTSKATLTNCSFVPPANNEKITLYNNSTNTDVSLIINGATACDHVWFSANTKTVINGKLTADVLTITTGASVTFSGVDSILAATTTASIGSASFTAAADSTGYLALPYGTTPPTVGTGVKTCIYGANIESASVSATVVSWTAETLSTPILIEQLSRDNWNTLTDAATGGTYSGTFGEGVTVRLFDGVNFYYTSRPAPYWLVNSFAVNASNGWIVDASAVATNGGGGTDPVSGDPLPYWTITTDDITPNF